MWGLNLNETANIIILIGAVIVAFKTIYSFFKKPVDTISQSMKNSEEQHIEEVLKREMPGLLETNCKTIMGSLEEIKKMTLE